MNQTQTGPPLVRRAGEPDADELARMLTGLTDLSRYFRFQTAIGTPPRAALLLRMLCPTGAAFVATRAETIVGHAMWAWAPGAETAELAAVIAEDEQRRGLGVRMLSVAAADAIAAGARYFLFVVSAANERSIRMVRRRWPDATVERDGTLLSFVAPARLPDEPEERADVVDQQVGRLEGGEVPAAGELRPVDDPVPAF
ncbi:acetyltransferase (GNAT) family protein [Kribbella jejuensis]|uniref:Acetyltransferase (GNAT) family protein n=1 Tax=Kribbella jejuensis TaxID=236068 RepID=A0A542E8H8_9ACTN|nr:acetyltransferase (GNAT) family protein [Kribbella jejuensis]